jgi:hypothetical protein
MSQNVIGNVMPDDREVWYRFRGVDVADTACDTYHVRVQITANPSNAFEITVLRGDCTTFACADMGYEDFEAMTDFADSAGMGAGECPCTADGARLDNVSVCNDSTQTYFVRVRRRAGAALGCAPYTIEISNGLY